MRFTWAFWLTAACLAGSGCSARLSAPSGFWHLAGRNLTQEPIRWVDDCAFKVIAHKHAKAAWNEVAPSVRPGECPEDYKCGFLDGFIDFLDAGGDGEPPLVPPFRYRLTKHMTPAGAKAVESWFSGFRHGSSAARASGKRESILVQLSGPAVAAAEPAPPPRSPAPPPQLPRPADGGPDARPAKPKDTVLPQPRELPEPDGDDPAVTQGPPGPAGVRSFWHRT
ncbi:MAG: hypothetical protein ACRC33_31770, partial [Gemmataceae bacterium]